MFLPLDGRGSQQAQLTRALKAAILGGRFGAGDRLPPTRSLAADLGLARNTVLASYEELIAEGFLVGRVGAGSFVADISGIRGRLATNGDAPDADPTPTSTATAMSAYAQRAIEACRRPLTGQRHKDLPYNLQYGVPMVDPTLTTAWRRELARAASYADLDYPTAAGHPDLRAAVCEYLDRRRGVQADPEDVLIIAGTQEAFALSAQVLLDAGDRVLLEDPHYPASWQVFQAQGARVDTVPVDDDGLICERLSGCEPPRLICVTPSHQFPLGAVMSLPRRLALLRYAQMHGAWILEDDYDGEFRYSGAPLAALRSLDTQGRTLYVGTFSKTLFPSLRMGYMVVPAALREAFHCAKRLATFGCPLIEQLALAHFMQTQGFDRHLRRAAHALRGRRAALVDGLREHAGDAFEVYDSQAGMHLAAWLPGYDEARLEQLTLAARARGVGLYSIAPYYVQPPQRTGVLLGYAGNAKEEIVIAMRRLGEALRAL